MAQDSTSWNTSRYQIVSRYLQSALHTFCAESRLRASGSWPKNFPRCQCSGACYAYYICMPEANTKFWLLPKNLNFLILYSLNLGSKADSKTVRGSAACGMQLKTNFWGIFFDFWKNACFCWSWSLNWNRLFYLLGPLPINISLLRALWREF